MKEFKFYKFSKSQVDGNKSMKDLLGGKGANLAEMASLAQCSPGFTIPTSICRDYYDCGSEDGKGLLLDHLMYEVMKNVKWVHETLGRKTLFSVRSGAPMSMPGMMDTILNVGIPYDNNEDYKFFQEFLGDRTLLDSQRRLIQMYGCTAMGIEHSLFSDALDKAKDKAKVKLDSDLDIPQLAKLCDTFNDIYLLETGSTFPHNLEEQLRGSIQAVFDSWMNERAIAYRDHYGIPHDIGTAVNIQSMVFGNANELSGTGVLFSRNPSTGENGMYGEYLQNAQGEDVVAGIRTPQPLEHMLGSAEERWPVIFEELDAVCTQLEAEYGDMMDIEFTVENGTLFILQCRVGKRSAKAAIKIAMDLHEAGMITEAEVFQRVTRTQYKMALRPSIDPAFKVPPTGTGLAASPGIGTGSLFTSSKSLVASNAKDKILVTKETDPDDLVGMMASKGILTSHGGATSHAAVVARGFDKPCVVGCTEMNVIGDTVTIGGQSYPEGTQITIDGSTGNFWINVSVPVIAAYADDDCMVKLKRLALKHMDAVQLIAPGDSHLGGSIVVNKDHYGNNVLITSLLNKGFNVTIDGSGGSALGDTVQLLEDLFAENGMADRWMKNLIALEAGASDGKVTLKNLRIIGDLPTELLSTLVIKHGVKAMTQPNNMAEWMAASEVSITSKFINDMFGGDKKAYDQFIKVMEQSGINKEPSGMAKAVYPTQAVFTVLKN